MTVEDAAKDRLLRSADGSEVWARRAIPAPVYGWRRKPHCFTCGRKFPTERAYGDHYRSEHR